MMRSLLRSLLLLCPCAALAAQDGLTPQRVAELRSVSTAQIAPDGARIAYTLSVPRVPGQEDDGPAWSELHVYDVAAGRSRAFVTGKVNVGNVSWTTDGRALAFLAKRGTDKDAALYLIPIDGGEARRALDLPGAIEAFDLAPDGKRVVCIAAPAPDEAREAEKKKGFAQEIYEEDGRSSELWIAELAEGAPAPRQLAFEGHPRDVRWSPVDERLLVAWTPTTLVDDDYMRKRVAVLDGTGHVLARIENPGKLGKIGWSLDGKSVVLIGGGDVHDPAAARLQSAPAGGGAPSELLPGVERDALDFAFVGPRALLLVAHEGCGSRLERLELPDGPGGTGGAAAAPSVRLPNGPDAPLLTSVSATKDGRRAALVASTPAHPAELFLYEEGQGAKRLTDSNPGLAGVALARQEVITHAARDGLALQGVLVHPLERAPGERVPLILTVHGGPEAHVSNGWVTNYSNPAQMAAARGFAVFHPNYRGSTGRGAAFAKLGQGDPAGKEFDDLVDAVDHLIAIGLVDGKRVGVTGGSYGGYATAWCSTKFSERFAAGVMFVGISDTLSKVGTTDISDEEFYVHALKRPWDDWQGLLERSPIYHAAESKTPLLILHGKDDPRVNPGQSRELYRHLKLRGQAPVRLVLYPGEGHGNRKAAARLDFNLRCLQWFEHYLKGPGGAMPEAELDYEAEPAPRGEG